jgi:hypothetical protein
VKRNFESMIGLQPEYQDSPAQRIQFRKLFLGVGPKMRPRLAARSSSSACGKCSTCASWRSLTGPNCRNAVIVRMRAWAQARVSPFGRTNFEEDYANRRFSALWQQLSTDLASASMGVCRNVADFLRPFT